MSDPSHSLTQAFEALGIVIGGLSWDKILKVMDVDGDGEVEYDELLHTVKLYQRGGWKLVELDKERRDAKKLFDEGHVKMGKRATYEDFGFQVKYFRHVFFLP